MIDGFFYATIIIVFAANLACQIVKPCKMDAEHVARLCILSHNSLELSPHKRFFMTKT